MFPDTVIISPSDSREFPTPLPSSSRRLQGFMARNATLIGLAIKHQHHATEQFLDDLIRDATKNDNAKYRFVSFKGAREVLYKPTEMQESIHPC